MSAIVPLGRKDFSDRNVGILIKEASLSKFLEKVVRGVNFLFGREKYISSFHEISFAVGQKAPVELFRFPYKEYSCGPGIFVRVWEDPEFPPCGIHEIQIWQQVDSLAFVENKILKPR